MKLNLFLRKVFLVLSACLVICSCNKDDNGGSTDDSTTDDDQPIGGFTGEIEWVKNYGGSSEDDVSSMVEVAGGYVMTGYTSSTDGDITDKSTTDADYWVFKTDTNGNLLWSKTYGGSVDDRASKIISTADGGFAVLGYSRSNDGDVSNNHGFYDYWFLKLDATGNLQWQKCYGFSGHDQGHSLVQTPDAGYLLVGFIDYDGRSASTNNLNEPLHGVGEYWAIKIDASGNEEWDQYYGGTNNDRAYAVVQTPDGGFLMVGNSESDDFDITDPKGSYDFWAVKINANGVMLWQKNYGGTGIEIAYGLIKSHDGNYYVIGDTRSSDIDVTNPKGNADIWLLKITGTGSLLWQKNFGGSMFDTSRTIIQRNDNSLVIIGSSRSSDKDVDDNYGESDFWVLIADASGNMTFEKNYGGSSLDFAYTGLVSSAGNIVMAGSSESSDGDISNNKGSKDVVLIKLKK